MSRVILVKTCQKYRARREACEATWAGKLRDEGIPVYFAEGGYAEEMIDGNMIKTASGDGYDDNSYKVRDALRMLLGAVKFNHIFVCDDNTFVQWKRWLEHEPEGEFEGLQSEQIPWAHGGAGWWMSRRCCERYVGGVQKRCSWDDTLATEILKRHRIKMINRPDLYAQWEERVSADNQLITCHNVEPDSMRELFESTYDLSAVCNVLSRA